MFQGGHEWCYLMSPSFEHLCSAQPKGVSWPFTKKSCGKLFHYYSGLKHIHHLTIHTREVQDTEPWRVCIQPCHDSRHFRTFLIIMIMVTHRPVPTRTPPTIFWLSVDIYRLWTEKRRENGRKYERSKLDNKHIKTDQMSNLGECLQEQQWNAVSYHKPAARHGSVKSKQRLIKLWLINTACYLSRYG